MQDRYRVVIYGDPVLRKVAEEVKGFDEGLKVVAERMILTMNEEEGCGLAAPQVGISKRLFVVNLELPDWLRKEQECVLDGKKVPLEVLMPMVVVNPQIRVVGELTDICEEGCLSLPRVRPAVERPVEVEMEYYDVEGVKHVLYSKGFLSKTLQHEDDHLNGKLTIDYLKPGELKRFETKLKQLKRETEKMMREEKRLKRG